MTRAHHGVAQRPAFPTFEEFQADLERGVIDDRRWLPLDAYGPPGKDEQPTSPRAASSGPIVDGVDGAANVGPGSRPPKRPGRKKAGSGC